MNYAVAIEHKTENMGQDEITFVQRVPNSNHPHQCITRVMTLSRLNAYLSTTDGRNKYGNSLSALTGVLRDWGMVGVQQGPSSYDNVPTSVHVQNYHVFHRALTPDYTSFQLDTNVREKVRTQEFDTLWLIARRERFTEPSLDRNGRVVEGANSNDFYWRLVPVRCRGRKRPDIALYDSEESVGTAIYVGLVTAIYGNPEPSLMPAKEAAKKFTFPKWNEGTTHQQHMLKHNKTELHLRI